MLDDFPWNMDTRAMPKRRTKQLYIENLGCAKNQVDAEVMAKSLENDGWQLVEEAKDADLIIVNTCGFIESAREESINTFLELKAENPKIPVIIAGCLAQRYAEELATSLPEAAAIFGNRDLSQINNLVTNLQNPNPNQAPTPTSPQATASNRTADPQPPTSQTSTSSPETTSNPTANHPTTAPPILTPAYPDPKDDIYDRDRLFSYPGSAYLKISEGCNHRCGFCAIPLIRGPLRSRPQETILKEARQLVARNIKEINLIAQDLAAYGTDWDGKSHFLELLKNIAAIEGNFKIRLLYIHPDAFPLQLLDIIRDNPKILPYFDIPIQHASTHLLRPMKRTGTAESYTQLIRTIREKLPTSVIRTTIMLGFPRESSDDFSQVYEFVKVNRFNWMGSFIYSREEGTYAYDLTDEKTHKELTKEAKKRQKKLQKLQEGITAEILQSFVGKEYNVLIEELIEGEDLAIGRIWAQAPEVDGLTVVMGTGMVPGNIYRCGITKVNGVDLQAVKID